MKKLSYWLVFLTFYCSAQMVDKAKDEMLKKTITPQRHWWDIVHYHLDVSIDPEDKYISGKNTIRYKVLEQQEALQIDLQGPMKIDKILQGKKELHFERVGSNAHFVTLQRRQKIGEVKEITVHFSGHPPEIKDPKCDGGASWESDAQGKTLIQLTGTHPWWPLKDHSFDKADSMKISITVPKEVTAISNGKLQNITEKEDTKTVNWVVTKPINRHWFKIHVGDYTAITETYNGEKGKLTLTYWTLRNNAEKAREQIKQVPKVFEALEYWFGAYPFYEDGFKLVDSPFWGIKQLGNIVAGNEREAPYFKGIDHRSQSDMVIDPTIVQTAAYEWFGKSISPYHELDLWLQEGFSSYAKCLVLEYFFGPQASLDFLIAMRKSFIGKIPYYYLLLYGEKSDQIDDYHKMAYMFNSLRHWLYDDIKWRRILREITTDFHYRTITAAQIELRLEADTGLNLGTFFKQYARFNYIPGFYYIFDGEKLTYSYSALHDFNMPVRIFKDGQPQLIYPFRSKDPWTTITFKAKKIEFDKNLYVGITNRSE